MTRIVIDAGHGGTERAGNSSAFGGRSAEGLLEKNVTLDIARAVVERLGGAAALTRARDANLSLGARAARAARDGAQVFVSIHANSGPPDASGAETWVHPRSGPGSAALAASIQKALDRLGGRYGGSSESQRGAMAVLDPSRLGQGVDACLVEVDYLSSSRGAQRLADPRERAAIGAAIAGAVEDHLRGNRVGRVLSEAAEIIDPGIDYATTGLAESNRIWSEWLSRYGRWRKGVPDSALTRFPHAAICQLRITVDFVRADGSTGSGVGWGTGFYIGSEKLLTVGHNFRLRRGTTVFTARSIEVQPGHSPVASTLPSRTYPVNYLDHVHPDWANASSDPFRPGRDMAVLRVPGLPATAGVFSLANRSLGPDEGIVVCGYGKVGGQPSEDQPQRMDGASIVRADHETMSYPIQTVGGHSGSPVFHDGMVVGIHRSGDSDTTNAAVTLTPDKIAWIDGR